jgi:hypothetical protein
MSTITRKKVNNLKVKPVPIRRESRVIKGANICPELYFNLLEVASTNVGKTTVTSNVVDHLLGRDTEQVIAFTASLYNDPLWNHIEKQIEKKDIDFEGHVSLHEDGVNLLRDYVDEFTEEAKARRKKEKQKEEDQEPADTIG